MKKITMLLVSSVLCYSVAHAGQMSTTLSTTGDKPQTIGEVVFTETPYGLLITPNLSNLAAGLHGFHLHQHPDCGDHAMKAGGHFDPAKTDSHLGPYADGHLGDLPVLYVSDKGQANTPILAPRLKLSDLNGLTLMVHAGGDNYSNTPALGGGGAREACGVIK